MSDSANGQYSLMRQRRFLPLFATQFLGALNDNVFKNALVILLTYHAGRVSGMTPEVLVNVAAGLFILPFFLFSATAGQLADKFEKSRLIRLTKLMEIAVVAVGAVGFALSSLPLLLGALFLMGAQSTLFGPLKYAILPQHLRQEELVGGNALVEAGTFLAILIGTIAGGLLASSPLGTTAVSAVALALALLGYAASRAIPAAAAPEPGLRINANPLAETWRILQLTRSDRTVFLSILGVSWFWLYGSVFLSQMPIYAKNVLGGNEHVVTLLLAVFSVGIGLGSLLCERLSGHKVEIGLVPFGSIGLTLFAVDLAFATPSGAAGAALGVADFLHQPHAWRALFDLLMIGLFGGFFIVPLYALVQSRSPAAQRSRIIAGNNIINALFMVVASLASVALLKAGLTIPQLFLVVGVCNAAVALFIYRLVPEFLMRFIVWLLIHSVYRLDKSGLQHIPEEGAAVLACNHVSFVDALVIAAACPRPIRFVMDHGIFRIPVLNFVFREGRAIPIASSRENPQVLERAYEEIASALGEGDLVGIFPEGRITDDGEIKPFRGGIRRIVERTPVPVVPMALRGLWGSFFSRKDGPAMRRPLRRGLFNRIALAVAPPLPPQQATPEHLQAVVSELRGEWR